MFLGALLAFAAMEVEAGGDLLDHVGGCGCLLDGVKIWW